MSAVKDMKEVVFFVLLYSVGIAGRCDYYSPVLVCININGTRDFAKAYEENHPRVIHVINGTVGNFDYQFQNCENVENVTFINVDFRRAWTYKADAFSRCGALKHLNLSRNYLRWILKLPKTLKSLDLSRNFLAVSRTPYKIVNPERSEIRTFYKYMDEVDLEEINLSHNLLEFFYFNNAANTLRTLDLSNNPLRSIELQAPRIMYLNLRFTLLDASGLVMTSAFKNETQDLSYNTPRIIDLSHANYKTLNDNFLGKLLAFKTIANLTVNFTGNPWSCSCYMKEARRTLLALKGSSLEVDWFKDLRCVTPEWVYRGSRH
jgi:hypothetical protein